MEFKLVKENLQRLGKIGTDLEGGISRVFGSTAMEEGKRAVEIYFRECGLRVYTDPAGNVHGLLSCGRPDAEDILLGSHLDTVKQGGLFDGLLGVVAAAEVCRRLTERKISLKKDLHVIATNGEEGNELGGTFGSRAMMGLLNLQDTDYAEKAERFGYSPRALRQARLDTARAVCWLELHIEQGPTLDRRGEKLGIVTGIVGLRRYRVTVLGESNHAGTTMMEDRNDALVSAAKLILMGDELARQMGNHLVETVGQLTLYPGSAPVIPGRVEMTLEIRNESNELLDAYLEEYRKRAQALAEIQIAPLVSKEPAVCDSRLIALMEQVCRDKKMAFRRMPSGATHDGNAMATQMPIGMLFVPSRNGISHSKEEWTDWEDIDRGLEIFYETVKRLALE
ncbi:MAG: M20 family metallo-hydrolase [Eubacteriales bacterium]|nr:M20 family metallo-hydrolase [Eubacteriales bacterium]